MKETRGCALALVAVAALCTWGGSSSLLAAASGASLPPGCTESATGPIRPITFEVSRHHGRVPVVSVCLDGHGPYPFVVSSGSGVSSIAPRLLRTLRLPVSSGLAPVLGVTCVPDAHAVLIKSWSMGPVPLLEQELFVTTVPSTGLGQAPMGIIGSDVLSRFGAVQVDYHTRQLRMLGVEGRPQATTTYVIGQAHDQPPPQLRKGRPTVSVPLTELTGPSGTTLSAPVAFGSAAPVSFSVDSGASVSSVVQDIATKSSLQAAGSTAPSWGAGCSGTVPRVTSGPWSLSTTSLPPQQLAVTTISGGVNHAIDGELGADVLGSTRWYEIDYQDAHLWMGNH